MTSPLDGKVVPFGLAVDKLHEFIHAPEGDVETDAGSMPNLRKLATELRGIAADVASDTASEASTAIEDRIYPGVYSTPPTAKPHSGEPPEEGDRCVILVGAVPYEHIRVGGGWVIPNFDSAALALSSGSSMVGYDDGTAQDVLDSAKPMQSYTALRAYAGRATGARITSTGVAGVFQRDSGDNTSPDNGGTIIVDASGRRWVRIFAGPVDPRWFGAKGDAITDDSLNLQKALSYCSESGREIDGMGFHFRVSDIGGLVPAAAGSWRDDRGLYVHKGIRLSNITIELAPGAAAYTTILNLYTGPGYVAHLKNVRLLGNGTSQAPGAVGREDGGLHGIRTYGNDDGEGVWKFGTLILENVQTENIYTDGILVRSIEFESLAMKGVTVRTSGRNGVTYNSRTLAVLDDLRVYENGWRTAPASGFHYEPDADGTGSYGGVLASNIVAEDNWENGVKFDLRVVGAITMGPVLISGVVSRRNGLLHGSVSRTDIGIVATGENTFPLVKVTDAVLGIVRCSNVMAGSANPPVKSLVLENVSLEGVLRVENQSIARMDYIRLTAPYINKSYGGFASIELVGAGGVALMDVDVGELYVGTDYSVRLEGINAGTSAPYSGRLNLKIGRIVGAAKSSRYGAFAEVYVSETDFGDNYLDARTAIGNIVHVERCKFGSREAFNYFIRAEAYKSYVMKDCWLRNVTGAGATPGGAYNNAAAAVLKLERDNIVVDASGNLSAYPVPATYTTTNVTADRTFDADTAPVTELADVVGTLIADLKTLGVVK